ncbi:MAG TPA: hypothetical protein VMV31_00945 [Terriglobales bacterium]|nr:hypothetical protein [Terriglobales bacterium]
MRRLLMVLAFLGAAVAAQAVPAAAVAGLAWRSIGPAATGGRIADVAVAQPAGGPETMYVGTASGGVFKSTDAGVSWTPIFDHAGGMMSIGAVAVAPSNPDIVWVGTGEVDNRQSSSWGDGIFKSLDGGHSWHRMGLADTRHIAKIVIDPRDPNTVYVAALGHLWGPNPERGVYKTSDGGASWKRVLYVNDNTGATDLAMSPRDPNLIFAALYQRQRKGWGYNGGGPGSGIYRSSDGGASWTELARGLPTGDKGRIGLALYPGNDSLVYAVVEADPPAGGRGGGRGGPRPPAKGGVFRSLDQGEHWEHMSGLDPRPSYYSRIYVDLRDPERVYLMGSERGFYISDDAGRHFRDVFSRVHGEDHVMWVDPADPNHLLIGGDGGVSISYDRGRTWLFRDNLPIGQFYNISTGTSGDAATPYLICGGLQDNGNWCTPSATRLSYGLSNRDAFNIGGGDGMQAVFDGNNHTLLVSLQNGNTNRVDIRTMQRQSIGPVLPEARPPAAAGRGGGYRWYWTSPLIVSHFNPRVVYTGANVLFRSDDEGASWKAISPDLTAHINRDQLTLMGAPIPADALSKNDGQDNFSALTVIAESPLDAQLLYTGADDGTLEVTRDGGAHWTNLTGKVPGLPPMTNVSGIEPSRFAAGRVYATFDGHFNDDYQPYIYVSDDYGQSWRRITDGLPETSVHRLRENPTHPDFLVAGLEEGVYASWDGGGHWTSLNTNLPPVPVYDLVYANGGRNLVLGTHGRGIWVLDDARPLAALGRAVAAKGGRLFPIAAAHRVTLYRPQAWFGWGEFFAPNPPQGAVATYYLAQAGTAEAQVTVANAGGTVVRKFTAPAQAGMNRAVWDLHLDPAVPPAGRGGRGGSFGRGGGLGPWAPAGAYQLTVQVPGQAALRGAVTVQSDPQAPGTAVEQRQQAAAVMQAYRLQQQLAPASAAAAKLGQQLGAMRRYLAAMGAPGAAALAAVQQADRQLRPIAAQVSRALGEAGVAERGMDGYEGAPTAQQMRQMGWARQDAVAGVRALNQFLVRAMPAAYAAVGGKPRWPALAPVAVPAAGRPGGR